MSIGFSSDGWEEWLLSSLPRFNSHEWHVELFKKRVYYGNVLEPCCWLALFPYDSRVFPRYHPQDEGKYLGDFPWLCNLEYIYSMSYHLLILAWHYDGFLYVFNSNLRIVFFPYITFIYTFWIIFFLASISWIPFLSAFYTFTFPSPLRF